MPPGTPPFPSHDTGPGEPASLEQVLRNDLGAEGAEEEGSTGNLIRSLAREVSRLSRALYEAGPVETARVFSADDIDARLPESASSPLLDVLDSPADDESPCVGWLVGIHADRPPAGPGGAGLEAALAAVFGAQTRILLSVGRGTHLLRMQGATGTFVLEQARLRIPSSGPRGGPPGAATPLAPALLRVLLRGGCMGPVAAHPLRRAAPAAFLVEQAGGAATDGIRRILDLARTSTEASLPLFLGSREQVPGADNSAPEGGSTSSSSGAEHAPLFGHRGLFRP